MKSRLALIAVLALGVFMSGTGATLAVTGLASSGSASSAQYPEEEEHSGNEHAFEEHNSCTNGSGGGNCSEGCESGSGSGSGSASDCETETQPARQVAASGGGSLPFTGFLAIPVLIIGVGLLGAGVAMRLRMRSGNRSV